MTFEQMISETLHAADAYEPSPDLFARVRRSIDEDTAHRNRVRNVIAWAVAGVAAVLAYVALTAEIEDGAVLMSFRALEVLVTAVMVAIVLVLGPAIRRFGETYERDVFRSSPETGRQVLGLLDIAYYLIFGAFILMTLVFDPGAGHAVTLAHWLQNELIRLGGLLLMMGILHVVLLVSLPVVGVIFSANQRRARIALGYVADDPGVDRVDLAITIAAWVVAGLVVLQLLFVVLSLVIGAQG